MSVINNYFMFLDFVTDIIDWQGLFTPGANSIKKTICVKQHTSTGCRNSFELESKTVKSFEKCNYGKPMLWCHGCSISNVAFQNNSTILTIGKIAFRKIVCMKSNPILKLVFYIHMHMHEHIHCKSRFIHFQSLFKIECFE